MEPVREREAPITTGLDEATGLSADAVGLDEVAGCVGGGVAVGDVVAQAPRTRVPIAPITTRARRNTFCALFTS